MAYDDDQFDISDVEDEEEEDSPFIDDENGDPIVDKNEEDLGVHGLRDTEEEDSEETF